MNAMTLARLARIAEKGADGSGRRYLRVGLIVPPSCFVVPNGWEFVHTAPFEGPSVIAAVLKGMGFPVTLFDRRQEPDPESLAGGALRRMDIVCLATYGDSFPYVRRAVEIAKAQDPARPVVLGGPLVSSAPRLVMENTSADYAVVGEGELTVIELFYLLDGKKRPGIGEIAGCAWKDKEGRTMLNPRRPQMRDLDAVPFQDLSVWPGPLKTGKAPEIYMSSSRGCSGHCTFCYRAMPAVRYKSPRRVRDELRHLKRYAFRFAWWSDLTFIDSIPRVHRLMEEAFRGVDFRWSCFTRVDGIDLEVLRHMRECGCDIVMYGFESITKKVLDNFAKRVRRGQIVRAISLTRKAGLKVGGLFIIGGPGETATSLRRTVEFCRRFREVTRVKYMSALPGTALYHDALRKGIIADELEHLYFLGRERSVEDDEILSFTSIPEHELRAAYRRINRRIEVRPYEYWNPVNRYLRKPEKFKASEVFR